MMTQEQVAVLLKLLERIADRQFTITQAADWPILLFATGIFAAMLGFMWRDLGKKFDSHAESLREYKADDVREHDKLWSALRDCQDDCCLPKGKGRDGHDRT